MSNPSDKAAFWGVVTVIAVLFAGVYIGHAL